MFPLLRAFIQAADRFVSFLYPARFSLNDHIRAAGILAVAGFFSGVLIIALLSEPDKIIGLKDYKPGLPSTLLDRKGRVVTTFFQDQRIMVGQQDIPDVVSQAFIAMEDNHFYTHPGIDVQAILRAALVNVFTGSVKQGGSTITQQLAKVILTNRERSLTRKAKEAAYALLIELLYSKQEILTMYFNQIYFGHGTYGIEAASRFYFKKSAKDLGVAEAAILASLPAAPIFYSPVRNPHRSLGRVKMVLVKMTDLKFITPEQVSTAYRDLIRYYSNLNMSPSATAFGEREDLAPYYSETVRQFLEKEIGRKKLYNGGLTIHGSIDLDHQDAAQKALWHGLKNQNKVSGNYIFQKQIKLSSAHSKELDLIRLAFDLPEFTLERTLDQYKLEMEFNDRFMEEIEVLNLAMGGEEKMDEVLRSARIHNPYQNRYLNVQGALVELDHKTGEVTALVGGLPFSSQNQINRAMQTRRQPGSTFKAILYAAALEKRKVTAASVFSDSPVLFLNEYGEAWTPENYSGGYRGFINLREAIRESANMVSIAVAREAGVGNILPVAERMLNLRENIIPRNLSVALGSYEISPLQMARAFSLFPRGGKSLNTRLINKVEDQDGNIILDFENRGKEVQIISTGTATVMTSLLETVVKSGTATGVRQYGYSGYAAGKTGTTDNFRDAWFAGFNQRYTSVVWIGYDRPSLSLGSGQSGGAIAAPLWGNFQNRVSSAIKDDEPYIVSGGTRMVTVCKATGKLPGAGCPETTTEIFIAGTEPTEAEDITGDELPKTSVDFNISNEDFYSTDN